MSVFIIAEIGVNHNGSLKIAKSLVDVAKKSGANAVKFQTFNAKSLVTKDTPKAKYQEKNDKSSSTQLEMLEKLQLSKTFHKKLIDYCKKKKIIFISTPFDIESIKFLNKLKLSILKIGSGEIDNLPYLEKIGSLNKKIIISTGMANVLEISNALKILIKSGTKKENITILHCTTQYPTPLEDADIRSITYLKNTFNTNIGYSDHTVGFEASLAAVSLGAQIIEKHLTFDNKAAGPDHIASMNPNDFNYFVTKIRNLEKTLGKGNKKPNLRELINKKIVRKSIIAKKNISKGENFTEDNLTTKRPGNGLSPMFWHDIIGKISKNNYKEDDLIKKSEKK